MGKGNRNHAASSSKKPQEQKKSRYNRFVKIGALALGVLFLAILIFGVLHTTGLLQKGLTAVRIGDEKISALDFNIYYRDIRADFLNTYGSTLQAYGYDLSAGFESQPSMFSEDQTWKEYFNEQAIAQLTQVVILYNEGKAAGHEMLESYQQLYDEQIESLVSTAEYYGFTADGYLNSAYAYGNGTTLKDLERVYYMKYYATSYAEALFDTFEYTDDEIEAYYLENSDNYDIADYYEYTATYQTYTYTAPAEGETLAEGAPQSEEEAEQMTNAAREDARARAEAFLDKLNAGGDFDALAKAEFDAEVGETEYAEGEERPEFASTLKSEMALTATGEVMEWVKAPERAEGDTEMVEYGSGFSVLQFVSRSRKEIPTATVRHILFSIEDIPDDATAEEKTQLELTNSNMRTLATDVFTEWRDGGNATEEHFAELAKQYSADSNAYLGGIYEHFEQGAMVESFDAWCFDPSRKYGDADVVVTDFGLHMMFFVSWDNPSYYYSIENALKNEAYNEHYAEIEVNYPVSSSKLAMAVCF